MQIEVFPYSVFYIFFEQYLNIMTTTIVSLLLALGKRLDIFRSFVIGTKYLWDSRYRLGPFYTTTSKGHDHEIVMTLETQRKAVPLQIEIEICVVMLLKVYCKNMCEQHSANCYLEYHPIHLSLLYKLFKSRIVRFWSVMVSLFYVAPTSLRWASYKIWCTMKHYLWMLCRTLCRFIIHSNFLVLGS